MVRMIQEYSTVILADGSFPTHAIPLRQLHEAERIVCCDGAVEKLLAAGLEPDFIVGDMDSIAPDLKTRYSSIIHHFAEQETNDLTKSVNFCYSRGWNKITILGATGRREDHTLGNLSLITDYAENGQIQLLTDSGVFNPQLSSATYESRPGGQVSIFVLSPQTLITTEGLVYPIERRGLSSWWQGTLNEAISDSFTVEIDGGKLLVFRKY